MSISSFNPLDAFCSVFLTALKWRLLPLQFFHLPSHGHPADQGPIWPLDQASLFFNQALITCLESNGPYFMR